jgi:hypothetical protein
VSGFAGIDDEFWLLFRITAPRILRELEQLRQGCLLTDSIRFQPRLPIPDIALRTLYRRVFRHRHRRPRRRFGGEPVAGSSGAH